MQPHQIPSASRAPAANPDRWSAADAGAENDRAPDQSDHPPADAPREYGGRKGPDPVRYGDWEKNGRCIDF